MESCSSGTPVLPIPKTDQVNVKSVLEKLCGKITVIKYIIIIGT